MSATAFEIGERSVAANFWGAKIIQPQEVLRDRLLPREIRSGMERILREFTLPNVAIEQLIEQISAESMRASAGAYDRQLQELLFDKCDKEKVRISLDQRARHVAAQIKPFLRGASLLDIGTGDGMVACNIQENFKRHLLVDVVDYLDPRVQLPFERYDEGSKIPTDDRSHDTAILTNVLHHSLDPMHLLRESWRVTEQRLIIIESVYADATRLNELTVPFCLSARDQFVYTSFFDWFYNRVLHSDVPVPFNYLSPQRWEQIFADCEMRIAFRQDLGIDVEIVPIHHFLYVLEKRLRN
jgi:Methyltransferase domain